MNDLVQLSEICEALGMKEHIAKRKATLGLLPIPVFRLSGTQKGPWFAKRSDLEAHIEAQAMKASRLHLQMRSAGV